MPGSTPLFPVPDCFRDDVAMSDWKRLGSLVVARRVELGYQTRGAFADACGINARILSDIEHGRRSNYDAVTIAKLENFFGWDTGSARRVVEGGEPHMRGATAQADTPAPPAVAPASRGIPDEIELIAASTTMSAEQKLRAIRTVLILRKEAETESSASREARAAPRTARNHS